jgi:hypothetical protein
VMLAQYLLTKNFKAHDVQVGTGAAVPAGGAGANG